MHKEKALLYQFSRFHTICDAATVKLMSISK